MSLYFTMGRPFPPSKLPLPMGGYGPPSNTWFPGPTQVLNPNGISIGSADLAGLTSVTDRHRPTDRPCYLVGNNRPHLQYCRWRSGAMGKAFGLAINRSQVQILLEVTLRNNLGQAVYTYVPLSPSSITWYRPKGSDALRLGR